LTNTYNRNVVWDIKKAAANIRNHGVEFSRGATVLDDPMAVTMEDARHGGQRFVTVGSDIFGRILVVVYALFRRGRNQIDFGPEGNCKRAEDL